MTASSVLLLLLLLSIGHGDQQNDSLSSGIVALTKAHNKIAAPLEVSCPEPNDIEPCSCLKQDGDLRMDCSQVQDEEQLRKVFSASFPTANFYLFEIWYNAGLKVLEDGVFGNVSFRVLVIQHSALETVSNDAFKNSFSTITEISIGYSELGSFPFERLAEFTSLTLLSLQHNKIHSLPPLSSSSLTILKLDHNPISNLTPDVFTQLSGIWQIHLVGTNLTEITPGVPELSIINLAKNSLTTLEEEVWRPALERGIRVILEDNSLLCGCDLAWLLRNPQLLFDRVQYGRCADGTRLEELDPADFDMCD